MQAHRELKPGDAGGYKYQTWYADIDTKRTSVEDLFRPQYWANCLLLKKNDLIRCVASDGSYDFQLKVDTHEVAKGRNAITVSMYPKLTPALVSASEGTAASELVPTVIRGKPIPRVDEISGKGLWRLIGLDGYPVGDPFQTKTAADAAYDEYLRAHKITTTLDQPPVDARTGEVAKEPPPATERPHQFSHATKKRLEKRQKLINKRTELEARNKARTAERLAAEAAADAA